MLELLESFGIVPSVYFVMVLSGLIIIGGIMFSVPFYLFLVDYLLPFAGAVLTEARRREEE